MTNKNVQLLIIKDLLKHKREKRLYIYFIYILNFIVCNFIILRNLPGLSNGTKRELDYFILSYHQPLSNK